MRAVSGEAVGAVQGIVGIIQELDRISAAVAAAIEQQGAATREIADHSAALKRRLETFLRDIQSA
jgi:methyl-accepting chemotaxis protein